MSESEMVRRTLRDAFSGRSAHASTEQVFDGLEWESAGVRPNGTPHSLFQQLNHLVYWQEFALRWLDGEKPATPEHDANSWPGAVSPADGKVWQRSVQRFKSGLGELQRRADESDLFTPLGPKTTLEILQIVASHNSYHAGQVAALRRALGCWPPPGGGLTW
jgi:uncharacterized damage-inducible protein DinB